MRRGTTIRNAAILAGARAPVMAILVATALSVSVLPVAAAQQSGPEPDAAAAVPVPSTVPDRVLAVIAAVCTADDPAPTALTLPLGGAIELSREPLRVGGNVAGTRHSLLLPDGARIGVDRIEPNGIRRRVVASYAERTPSGLRPVLLAVANGWCRVVAGRRLDYEDGNDGVARSIAFLDGDLERTLKVEPLNPPVPALPETPAAAAGIRVAVVDSGVNYLLPKIASRLARNEDGGLIGYDFWDLDERPFDANPAGSAFHPQRHGTRTASLILEEAPVAVLVPYRYPRNAMSRMPDLVGHAAAAGVRIMNISMGSRSRTEWADFEAVARAHPGMLFVVSAGNSGKDIDEDPVWPASLPLDNLLTVTSSDHSGLPARGSNWGPKSVDLAVPAEDVLVIGFNGRPREVSGSSYAAARVSALAACLLAAHPRWTAPDLISAILARAEAPAGTMLAYVGAGTLSDPVATHRGACAAEPTELVATPLVVWGPRALYPEGTQPAHTHAIRLDILVFSDSGWRIPEIHVAVGRAARILGQCEVSVARARVLMVEAPRRHRYLHDDWSRRLVKRLAPSRPAVFFVEDTMRDPAFEAEAFGQANTRSTPAMRDTVWITRDAIEVGTVLAHELFHVLADLGRHETDPDNLMHERTDGSNTRLYDWQCHRLRRVATAFRLAVPVR